MSNNDAPSRSAEPGERNWGSLGSVALKQVEEAEAELKSVENEELAKLRAVPPWSPQVRIKQSDKVWGMCFQALPTNVPCDAVDSPEVGKEMPVILNLNVASYIFWPISLGSRWCQCV